MLRPVAVAVGRQPFQGGAVQQSSHAAGGGAAHGLDQGQCGATVGVWLLLPGEGAGEAAILETLRCVGEQSPLP